MTKRIYGERDTPEERQRRLSAAIEIMTTGYTPEQPKRLTHQDSEIVVATDQWEDLAAVWFVRRGKYDEPVDEIIVLQHDGNQWSGGGGGGGAPGATLEKRLTLAELENHAYHRFDHTDEEELIPFGLPNGSSSSSQGHAIIWFQTVTEAATLVVTNRKPRQIADHGYCLVVYTTNRPPTIAAQDAQGNSLGSFTATT